MTRRKTLTRAMTLDIVTQQLSEGRVVHVGDGSYRLGCALCGKKIDRLAPVIGEHMTPLANGGEDSTTNIRFVHKHCADLKTNSAKHTTYGSDKHETAKVKRIRGETRNGPKKQIQSRGFDTNLTRKPPTKDKPYGETVRRGE